MSSRQNDWLSVIDDCAMMPRGAISIKKKNIASFLITPYNDGSAYHAIIVPQQVAQCNLITVNVNGRDFNLPKAFTFQSGKRHTFTVTLDKTSSGVNVTIGAWENDGNDNGGSAI